jgi:DNA-binding transcriptional ArsR family regulator
VPELSRAELLVRLGALADDTRLSILKLVADQGESRSQDIMQALDLSQSGASRHLQQLAAAGFLHERRCNGAKCYALNGDRIDATLQALGSFLTPVAAAAGAGTRNVRVARPGARSMK